ncbi:uncharacterized protein LOC131238855 [Magnolia sinica]|uniref:uncharacterized protein LOC131238855 n=1 Tax=Magnolia sinica TaxID=86752 RepID=UPI00265B1A5E|nr:uncharacterized protein LOC131238855 [Magnolia sinica]
MPMLKKHASFGTLSRAKNPPNKEQQMRIELSSTATSRKGKDDQSQDNHRPNKQPNSKFKTYTPLNKTPEQVPMEIQDKRLLHWLNKLKSDPKNRSKNKYYLFHRNHGHNTSDCFDLKQEIEALIRNNHLGEYVNLGEYINHRGDRVAVKDEQPVNNEPTGEIHTIIEGHGGGGDLNNAKKVHVRNLGRLENEVLLVRRPLKEQKVKTHSLTFTKEDPQGIHHPHDDALMVTLTLPNREVFRILVDTRSSADVLFIQAFDKMRVG